MAKISLLDYLPKRDEAGNPVYRVYWARGQYRESDKDRPWIEIVTDPDGIWCWPISHYSPPARREADFFHISPALNKFANLKENSWVDVTEVWPLESDTIRLRGFIKGETARKFTEFLKTAPHVKRPRAQNPSGGPETEIYIAPWLYLALGIPFETVEEQLALMAYRGGHVDGRLRPSRCFFSAARRCLLLPRQGDPDPWYWFRAYTDWLWQAGYIAGDIKAEWSGLIAAPHNQEAAEYLKLCYIEDVQLFQENEVATDDVLSRIILSEAAVWAFTDPTEIHSQELFEFVEAVCKPFFFRAA